MTSIEAIQQQIDNVSPVLKQLACLAPKPTRPVYGDYRSADGTHCYDKITVSHLEEDINRWQYATKTVLATCFGTGSEHYRTFERTIIDQRVFFDAKEELYKEVNNGRNTLSAIIEAETLKSRLTTPVVATSPTMKKPKVFISHKKEDKSFADALVSLITFIIGAGKDKIFCSSVPGYGIHQSGDILDEMKAQFDNYEVFMVIIHSPRYYKSSICLNEMGAAWVLGTRFASFMTSDCKAEHLCGVINREKICIDINDDAETLNAHLNDFKDDLMIFFGSDDPEQSQWENARGRFVREVEGLTYAPVPQNEVDLFQTLYIPAFDHIFELLDVDHFQQWAYPCAIGGNTILRADIYDNLDCVPNYVLSRPKHKEYSSWNALMQNLGLLASDISSVFSQHAEKLDKDRYYVEPFYKSIPNNPHYETDIEAYKQHVMLVSDMLFELARLCNLILGRIRELYPEYKKELGILHIDNRIDALDLVYQESEISDTPYPGLKEYIKVRLTREPHMGDNPHINASGYEQKNK